MSSLLMIVPYKAAIIALMDYDPYWSNVVLLTHMDESITKDEKGNVGTIVGTGVSQSATGKFSKSLICNRTSGSYVKYDASSSFALGANFTVEGWFNFNNISNEQAMVGTWDTSFTGWLFGYSGSSLYFYDAAVQPHYQEFTPTVGQWYHIAISCTGGTARFYVNGQAIGSAFALTMGAATDPLTIGNNYQSNGGGNRPFSGKIDEVRITKGIGRYTANFNVPTAAFPSQGNPLFDPIWGSTVLLLKGNGDGQNHTFLDSSSNNLTLTRTGNVSQGSYSPFAIPDGYWSSYFDGTSYATIPDALSLRPDASDFTLEFWFNALSVTATQEIYTKGAGLQIYLLNGAIMVAASSDNTSSYFMNVAAGLVKAQAWTHFALVKHGSNYYGFVNGVKTLLASAGQVIGTGASATALGCYAAGQLMFTGHLSNVRFVKSNALYTNEFVPSLEILNAVPGTSLLTGQSNRLKDNSSQTHVISSSGLVKTSTLTPFHNVNEIVNSVGSAYFDGNEYVYTPSSALFGFGADSFTIETWVYKSVSGTTGGIFYIPTSGGSTDFTISITSANKLQVMRSIDSQTYNSVAVVLPGSWNHVAVVRQSTSLKLFVNGKLDSTFDIGTLNFGTSGTIRLCDGGALPNLVGYLSNARISKGIARYTSDFTPAIVTSDANTSLLLNFANGQVVDSTGRNVLETVGDAKSVTNIKVVGTGCMSFDGVADLLVMPRNTDFIIGTGDFTIEMWAKLNAVSQERGLFQLSDVSGGLSFGLANSIIIETYLGKLNAVCGSNTLPGVTALANNVWYHIAFTRQSGTLRLFLNGNVEYTQLNNTTNLTASYLCVGGWGSTTYLHNGFLDDFRFTNGHARYTGQFTPRMSEMPAKQSLSTDALYDSYWNNTVLSIPFEGTVADVYGNTVTPSGAVTYSAGKNGQCANFSSNYLTITDLYKNLNFGSSDFTIETWVKFTATPTADGSGSYYSTLLSKGFDGGGSNLGWALSFYGANRDVLSFSVSNTGSDYSGASGACGKIIAQNVWYHVAVSKRSGVVRLFLDGVLLTSFINVSIFNSTQNTLVGQMIPNSAYVRPLNGSLDGLRISNGVGRYVENFTPPMVYST